MKKFIHKYVERFKNIKNALEPSKMKKTKGPFCDGKTRIHNHDLYLDGLVALKSMETDFDNGNLTISYYASYGTYYSIDIEHFADFIDSGGGKNNYGRLAGYYLATMYPDDDIRDYYFQILADLTSTTSYPQLPPPNGVSEYGEWLDDEDRPFPFGTPKAENPPCVQVRSDVNDYWTEDVKVVNEHGGSNINDYLKPGYKNVYYKKGYAIQNELRALSQSSTPNLAQYNGTTPIPGTSPTEYYPEISYKDWLTSDSEYPDINGVMQSSTPYTPYSYKDFLFRLKAWAENPSYEDGQLKFPFYALYSGNANKHLFRITRFRGLFFGIDVNMSPHQVFNHFHKMKKIFGANSNIPSGNYNSEPITLLSSTLQSPHFVVQFSGPIPSNTQSMNNVVIGAPFETSYFDPGSHYNYAQNSAIGLPSGLGKSIGTKIEDAGTVGIHNGGAENCEGCDWGCWWDFKTREKKCSNTQNRAFPFKDKSDCENFRTQYPDYLCKSDPPNMTPGLDNAVMTGIYDSTQYIGCTDPTALNFCATCTSDDGSCVYYASLSPYDCTDDCMLMPLNAPMSGYPTGTVWNCGVKDFNFSVLPGSVPGPFGYVSSLNITACATPIIGALIKMYVNGQLLISGTNTSSSISVVPNSPGMYTATVECSNTTGISYWDICLDWVTPPSPGYPGVLKQVHCVNGRTPCCPNPPCIAQEDETISMV